MVGQSHLPGKAIEKIRVSAGVTSCGRFILAATLVDMAENTFKIKIRWLAGLDSDG